MVSLNDKLMKSKRKLDDYLRIKEDIKNINSLDSYNKNLKDINNKLKEINSIIEALEGVVGSSLILESQIKLKQLLYKFAIKLKGGNIDRFNPSYLQYTPPMHESLGIIKNEYNSAWQRYYERNYKSSINLLDMLNTILDDSEIMKIKNDISKFEKKWPINISDLEELEISYNKSYKKIKDLDLNDNIQLFLEKLLDNQIILSDINNEIYSWLKTNALVNKIKLRI